MKLNKHLINIVLFLPFWVYGQSDTSLKGLPDNYVETEKGYLFPINPGQQNYLAGTMGELRSTHLHSGLDIRTEERIGMPVLAAQDGYVAHVSINPFSYGSTLYIAHENEETTLYAHLSKLTGALADSIRAYQYKKQSFGVEVDLEKGKWLVKRGDTIAYSGNSGSSGGPHLHFDIRNANNEALNPLQYGFKEIIDKLPPVAVKVALQTMNTDSRINGRFGRFEFLLQQEGGHYIIDMPIYAKGRIGMELLYYDKMDGSPFRCGVNFIEVQANAQKVFSQRIEKINFSHTRDVIALINYNVLKQKKEFFNKLYIADGNRLTYYEGTKNRGFLLVADKNKEIRILLKDTYGNQSDIVFSMLPSSPAIESLPKLKPLYKTWDVTGIGNTLVVRCKKTTTDTSEVAHILHNDASSLIKPAYSDTNQYVFLIDMQKILPDSMIIGKEIIRFGTVMIPSETPYTYRSKHFDIKLGKNTLYDTVFIHTSYRKVANDKNEIFVIGTDRYPLRKSMKITLKPAQEYMENAGVYENVGKKYRYVGGKWHGREIAFFTKNFGEYTILEDNQPPVIRAISIDNRKIRFNIQDELSGIATYRAYINNKWLLMNYDPKKAMIWSDPMDKTNPLKGLFLLEVLDNAGNKSTYEKKI